ncbi:MAG: PQQ-binding-like beta-propeller repeat protein [Gemmataceae bacterium]
MPRWLLAALLLPAAARAGQSNSLLDVHPDGSRLLAVNSDNGSVTVVDLRARKTLHEVPVGDKPEGATWIGQSSLALVTVYRDDVIAFLDARDGKVVHRLKVEDEPYGIVALKDGSKAYVTLEYPGKVIEIDVASRKVTREMPAGEMVRGIALSPDEKRLYVTEFLTGVLVAIDRESGKVVDRWQGHSTDNLARNVVIHPTRPKAYLSHIRSKVNVNHGNGSIFPQVSICDLVPAEGKETRRVSVGMDTYNGVYVVTNPWESALSPDGRKLYTVYAGTNDMNVSNVIDDDYREMEASGRPRQIGQNPRAVRTSPDGKEVYIYNVLDFTVTVHGENVGPPLATIQVCKPPKSPEWVRGKVLFSTAKYPLTRARWIACASCHPDGHSDGRVWKNPEGLRRTMPLFGLAHTHPLHWSADRDESQDFEYTIRGRLMQGAGLIRGPMRPKVGFRPIELEEKTAGRSKDLDALAIYTNSFTFTLSPHIPAPGKLSAEATRGKAVFFDDAVGCAKCHTGPYYSDSTLSKPFKLHDVGTGDDDPLEKMGPKYDTPTLLGVYRSAPYLHHGKAKTLLDVLTTANKDDRHGKTSHLRREQLDGLVAFLKSLPYETPPDETPNTVKDRFVAPRKKG